MEEAWEELIDRGVHAVTLTDENAGRNIYRLELGPP